MVCVNQHHRNFHVPSVHVCTFLVYESTSGNPQCHSYWELNIHHRLRHIFTIITAAKEKFSSNGPNYCLVPFLFVFLAFIVLTMLDGFATFINQLYCKTHTPWYCTSVCPVGLTLHITQFLDVVCYWLAQAIDNNDLVWKAWHVPQDNRMWHTSRKGWIKNKRFKNCSRILSVKYDKY